MRKDKQVLRVRAVGDVMVQDYRSMVNKPSITRYVGRRYDPQAHNEWKVIPAENRPLASEILPIIFVNTQQVVEVPATKEFIAEVREGNLEAVDEDTAILCGAPVFYHLV